MQTLSIKLLQRISFDQAARCCSYSTNNVPNLGQPTAAPHPELLKEGEITPVITSEEYLLRRKRLLDLLPEKTLAIIAAAPVKTMTDVVPYMFRQDADYPYITGCQQPGGVAVLGHGCARSKRSCMPRFDVIWQGKIAGLEAAVDMFKVEQSFSMNRLQKILPDMIRSSSNLFHNVETATPAYTELEAFQKADNDGKVKDFSLYTHEA